MQEWQSSHLNVGPAASEEKPLNEMDENLLLPRRMQICEWGKSFASEQRSNHSCGWYNSPSLLNTQRRWMVFQIFSFSPRRSGWNSHTDTTDTDHENQIWIPKQVHRNSHPREKKNLTRAHISMNAVISRLRVRTSVLPPGPTADRQHVHSTPL